MRVNCPPFDTPRRMALALAGGAVGLAGGALLLGVRFGFGRKGTATVVVDLGGGRWAGALLVGAGGDDVAVGGGAAGGRPLGLSADVAAGRGGGGGGESGLNGGGGSAAARAGVGWGSPPAPLPNSCAGEEHTAAA